MKLIEEMFIEGIDKTRDEIRREVTRNSDKIHIRFDPTDTGHNIYVYLKDDDTKPQPYSNAVKAEIARLDRKIDDKFEVVNKNFSKLSKWIN